ncbi:MAG: hypothetical protein JSV48_07990, partial [Bradyrhizobium sp.]
PKVKTGHRFIAVTDPGSSLEKAAKTLDYARIFHGEPSIGGRYSVLHWSCRVQRQHIADHRLGRRLRDRVQSVLG